MAMPPNYVHSLDATHMMLTSLFCERYNQFLFLEYYSPCNGLNTGTAFHLSLFMIAIGLIPVLSMK